MATPARLCGGRRGLAVATLAVVGAVCVVACGSGDDERALAIEIRNARARFTTTDVGAVYFEMRGGGEGDVLLGASSEIADDVQIHEVVSEGGSARMRAVEGGIAVAAGGRVVLEPGGYHVMLLGVRELPEAGAVFNVVLEFEKAGLVTVAVRVQELGDGDDGMDHEDDDGHE